MPPRPWLSGPCFRSALAEEDATCKPSESPAVDRHAALEGLVAGHWQRKTTLARGESCPRVVRVRQQPAPGTGSPDAYTRPLSRLAPGCCRRTGGQIRRRGHITSGIPYLSTMLRELEGWMDEHSHAGIMDVRGKLSQKHADDPFLFERAQYVNLLMSQ
jgi:hypothetical protein